MSQSLAGKVVVITGGLSTLGRAVAVCLAKHGVQLVLHYCHPPKISADELLRPLSEHGARRIDLVQADFSTSQGAEEFVRKVLTVQPRVDILVNNAGVFFRRGLVQTGAEDWNRIMTINALAPALLMAQFKEAGAKEIVNILDIAVHKAWKFHGAYTASKAALDAVTRVAAVEWAPEVRVNAVAPGMITVPDGLEEQYKPVLARIPMGRPGSSGEIAEAVEMLLLAPRYITGQIVTVDGGLALR